MLARSIAFLTIPSVWLGLEAVSCKREWLAYHNKCFGVFTEETSWSNAEVLCQRYGEKGHLASFLSAQENEIVAKRITNNYPEVQRVWIGFHDPKKIGRWKWSDSSTTNFRPWSAGEPSKRGEKRSCVFMSLSEGFRRWTSADCKEKMPFLCSSLL
ncbi:regenerating islet-derived protein 4 [Pogona vitticeps]